MDRRHFIAAAGATAASLAGCLGGASPPPRRSNVVSDVEVADGTLRIDLADDVYVESRADVDAPQAALEAPLAALLPVGRAAAAKGGGSGGRGAAGRGSGGYGSAPKTDKGRAKYYGGAYVGGWRDDHDDEIERYDTRLATVGVAFLGTDSEFEDDKPGPGQVPWDRTYDDPGDVETYPLDRTGWYRVGMHLLAPGGGHDFGWEAVDFQVAADGDGNSYGVGETWKVSPRL